jgi:hypothetical protein
LVVFGLQYSLGLTAKRKVSGDIATGLTHFPNPETCCSFGVSAAGAVFWLSQPASASIAAPATTIEYDAANRFLMLQPLLPVLGSTSLRVRRREVKPPFSCERQDG